MADDPSYVLVLLHDGPNADAEQLHSDAHRDFIESLIARNLVLLGGALRGTGGMPAAAYVLRCSLEDARAVAAEDPLVRHGVVRAEPVMWELVGINPEAVDPGLVVTPGTMAPP